MVAQTQVAQRRDPCGDFMRLIDRYIARAVLAPTSLALAVLLTLNAAYLFIDEQSNIGQGSYSMLDAAKFVLLQLPKQLFELTPAAALVGAMIGLGDLSRRSEIVAMRAAGVSVRRLMASLALVGVFVVLFDGLVGEYVAPQMTAIALQNRGSARTKQESAVQGATIWVHEGGKYVRVETAGRRDVISGVTAFEPSAAGDALVSMGRAENVTTREDGSWWLKPFRRVLYEPRGVTEVLEPTAQLHMSAGKALLDAAIQPDDRSVGELLEIVQQLQANHQDTRVFVFALWSRVAHAVAALWCVLLALPFAFGTLRAAKPGVRIFVAVGIGIVFVLSQQIVESGVVLSGLHPAVLAWLPTAALALVTSVLVFRIH